MEETLKEENEDIFKIKLQNFQSIEVGEVCISNGLTIVTGDTNQGKTAIIRAVDCAVWNTGSDDLVKAGCKIAGVTISNGKHQMVYCRNSQGKNEKTAYQFDGGTVQKKVGRAQLPEVLNMFGIREVRMQNGIKMKLNFWYQNDKPFLMDKTSGQLYEFLSLSSCDKYVKVLKQMVVDLKVQEAEINNCNVKIDTLKSINNHKQEYIDANEGFDDVYQRTILASDRAKKLNSNISDLENIKVISGNISNTRDKLTQVSEKLDKIDIRGVSDRYAVLDELDNFYSSIYETMCEIKSIQDSIKDTKSKLQDVSDRYEVLSKKEKILGREVKRLSSDYGKFLELFSISEDCVKSKTDIDTIKNRIISLDNNSIDTVSIESRVVILDRLDNELRGYSSLITELKSLKSNMSSITESLSTVDDKISKSENELEDFKKEVGYCPFCGSVFGDCKH